MASTEEMLRLVRHCVLKLDGSRKAMSGPGSYEKADVLMSMAYASAILSMVGACMMDDEPAEATDGP